MRSPNRFVGLLFVLLLLAPPALAQTPPDGHTIEGDLMHPESVAYETNETAAHVSAVDPDGVVTGMEVVRVRPEEGEFEIPDGSGLAVDAVGETATAEVVSNSDNLPGTYEVTLRANPESLGERAECTLVFEVKPIDLDRIGSLVGRYRESDDIEGETADDFRRLLNAATTAAERGATKRVCTLVEEIENLANDQKDDTMSDEASEQIESETKRLHENLGCE